METATEKWGGGGGRDFLYHIACEARHLGGSGSMPPQEIFWFLGSIRSNLVQSEEVLC